jgi:radical SAM superfamily enzyme YgiQ (UPF0313 family)
MKVVLINPPSPFLLNQKSFPPLGILYLASSLRQNKIDVDVEDLANKENELESVLKTMVNAGLYGITSTTSQYIYAKKIKNILKKINPNAKIVIGGAHASSVPEQCKKDGFDVVVVGEGENAIVDIANKCINKKEIPPIVSMPYIQDMDLILFPARDMIDIQSYWYDIDGNKATTIITSRGCPYQCAFCSKDVWKNKVRFNSIDYVCNELKEVIEKYGFKYFLFLDDTITVHRKRLFEFCDKIKPLNIKWRCYARSSTTKDMLIAMKEAGCVEVGAGIESGSQKILDIIGKNITVSENTRFINDCKEVGITANVFIMIGLPGETYETVMETKKWMEEVRPDKFGFNIFLPYVGTPIYNKVVDYDITLHDVPEEKYWVKGKQGEYDAFVSTSKLSSQEILKLFSELFEYYTNMLKWQPGIGTKK